MNHLKNLNRKHSTRDFDGVIFITISNGVSGQMPAMRENLPTAHDRWDVVNYVRKLERAAP